jgi:27-O-demethylrifamycin SV methyltransferase
MATGLPDDSFDRIWIMESSHLMLRKDLLFEETARLLRPGGKVVLCDIILLRNVPFTEVLQIRKQVLVLDQVFGKAKMQELSSYATDAEKAGLRPTLSLDITANTFPTFSHWKRNAETHAAEVETLIGHEGLELFKEACDILTRFWSDSLGYGLFAAERPVARN